MCCLKCEHLFHVQFESFHCISLSLISNLKKVNELTLKDCLNAFVSSEILKNVVCENCEKLEKNGDQLLENLKKMKSTFVKRLTFAKLPQMLVIHFQRLICLPNGIPIKKEDRIRFPNILIMDEYEHYAIQQKSNLNVLNNSTISNILNKSNNSIQNFKLLNKQKQLFTNNLDDKLQLSSDCNDKNLIEELVEEMKSIVSKENNHLDRANLSNNNISKITSTLIKQENEKTTISLSSSLNLSSDLSNNIKECKIEQQQNTELPEFTLNTAINLVDNSSCISNHNDKSTSFINNSQQQQQNKTFENLNDIKNETKATSNEYSNSELSNRMSSNPIQLNTGLTSSLCQNAKYKYKLNSAIVHLGSSFSGHYISYRRSSNAASLNNRTNSDWYFTSDNVIRPSSLEEALRSNAYMLFYERIK